MKKKIQTAANSLIAIGVGISLLFTACDPSKTINQNNTISDQLKLVNTFSDQALKPTKVTITNSVGASIVGPGQSRLIIQPNTFINTNGQIITGDINIEFTDYSNRSDMIFSRILPISNNNPLISGGEYNLVATQNGAAVFISSSKPIEVKIPQFGLLSTDMSFFKGEKINFIDANAQNTVNWLINKGDSNVVSVVLNGDTISIFNNSTGLANADKFYNNPTYVEFPINLTGAKTTETTFMAYCLYKNYNNVWPLIVEASNNIIASHIPNVQVHLIVFGYDGSDFYSGILENHTPTDGTSVNINLSKTDITTLKNKIKSLAP
jgi:hypothetical protein